MRRKNPVACLVCSADTCDRAEPDAPVKPDRRRPFRNQRPWIAQCTRGSVCRPNQRLHPSRAKSTMTKHSTFAVSTRAPLKRAAAAAVAPSVRRRRWCLCYDGPVNLPWMSECCCRTTLLISLPAPSNASLVEHPPTSAVSLWLILPDQFAVIVCRIGHFPVSVVQ